MNRKRNAALHDAITESGWKQWIVADKANITEQRLSNIKAGRQQATVDERKALAKVLRVPVAKLFPKEVSA